MSSIEVQDAVGAAPDRRKSAVVLLAEKRQALETARKNYATAKAARDHQAMSDEHRLIDELLSLVPELEREAQAEQEAAGRVEAERRTLGIKKAYGSVLTEYAEDDQRVEQCRKQLADAMTKRNARADKLAHLETEARALADRFGLSQTQFESVAEPEGIELPRQWRTVATRPQIEETTDSTRRTRRSYAEISGSPGYEIIQRAGLKPFRPLTPAEQETLTEKENRKLDPELAVGAVEAHALGNLRIPGGNILRG